MTLEEKILAYLDGALDEESSEELLHSLSVSPEKRALLQEHLALKNMFALGQKPFSIPASVEASIVERIPALGSTGELATRIVRRSAFSTLFAGASEWFGGLLQAPSVRWSLGFASVAAIGITAWLLSGSPENLNPSKSGPVASSTPAATAPSTRSTDRNSTNSVGQFAARVSSDGASSGASIANDHPARSITRSGLAVTAQPQSAEPGSGIPSAAAESVTDLAGAISAAHVRHEPKDQLAASTIDPSRMLRVVPLPVNNTYRNVHLTIAYGQYAYQLADVGSTLSVSVARPELGLSYDLSDAFALKLEGGSTVHPSYQTTAKSEHVTTISGQSYSRVVYNTNVQASEALFTRLGFEYTVNRGDNYEVHVAATGGVQMAGTLMPLASFNAGITRALNSMLSLDLAAVALGAWGHEMAGLDPSTVTSDANGPVGVVHREVSVGNSFMPAFGFRAGLRYQF